MDAINSAASAAAKTATNTAAQAKSSSDDKESKITSDFNTFLKLLTTQLENQDPLNPLDSTQFAEQLATFSGVEQQTNTNKKLDQLIDQNAQNSLAELAGWVGRAVTASDAGLEFSGSTLTLKAPAQPKADHAEAVIRNQSGTEVARLVVSPQGGPFKWNGQNAEGQDVSHGVYSVEYHYRKGEGASAETWTQSSTAEGKVREARRNDGAIELVLDNGSVVAPKNVTAISDPTT